MTEGFGLVWAVSARDIVAASVETLMTSDSAETDDSSVARRRARNVEIESPPAVLKRLIVEGVERIGAVSSGERTRGDGAA